MKSLEVLQPLQNSLSGLPLWVSERILQQISQLTHYEPVTDIMGKAGAGESSLCNVLFAGEVLLISDVVACVRDPLYFRPQIEEHFVIIMDLSGVGESDAYGTECAALCREQLPRFDLILQLIKTGGRTLAADEHFCRQMIDKAYRHKMLLVISRSDKTGPTSGGNIPSIEQKQNISCKICLLHELFQPVYPVYAASVCLQWGLRVMAERMIKCLSRKTSSPVVALPRHPPRTAAVWEQAHDDFGETVGAILDTVNTFPFIPALMRTTIQAVRSSVVPMACVVWDFFF